MSFLLPRLLLASAAVFIAAPLFVYVVQLLTLLIGGQLFVLVWLLPLLYCLFRSIPGVKS